MNVQSKVNVLTHEKPTKKAYRIPKLLIYGNIHEVTKGNDNQGSDDNGTPPRHKT
jgi:hypothetical protein